MESEPLLQKRADGKVLVIVTEEGLLGAVIDSETLVVTNVSADSIAVAAGLQAGEKIVRITGAKANICIGDDNIVPGTKFYSAVHKALLQRPMQLLLERRAIVPSSPPHNSNKASDALLERTNKAIDALIERRAGTQSSLPHNSNKAIAALLIVAQHDGCKWAHECRYVKDLCKATRAETGLWSAMARVHYGRLKRTLLMYEAQRGRLDRVQWLLALGAPRDARDDVGLTAMIWASQNCHTDTVRALIAAGARVNIADELGKTSLLVACARGHTDIVRALISANARFNIADELGHTPLLVACARGHTDIVRALISAKANVNTADYSGRTPRRCASENGHTDIVRVLRDAGGN